MVLVEALQTHTHTSTLISTIRHLHKTKKSTRYDIYESPHLYHVPNDNHLIRRIIIIILWIFHFILLFSKATERREKSCRIIFNEMSTQSFGMSKMRCDMFTFCWLVVFFLSSCFPFFFAVFMAYNYKN